MCHDIVRGNKSPSSIKRKEGKSMWFIWLLIFMALCIIGIAIFLIGHTIWLISKRNEKIFELENRKMEEEENE